MWYTASSIGVRNTVNDVSVGCWCLACRIHYALCQQGLCVEHHHKYSTAFGMFRVAMSQVVDAKARAEAAQAEAATALTAAQRKADQYKQENSSLLSEYDNWVQSLLSKKDAGSNNRCVHEL